MKKLLSILIFTVFGSTELLSQNLVPNPSFEIITNCVLPDGGINSGYVPPWDSPNDGTSDPYNICSTSCTSAPSNCYGFQHPHSGNGYAGFDLFSVYNSISAREYLQIELNSPLIANQNYCASFYVSLADDFGLACNNFGIYFSTSHYYVNNYTPINFTPQINNTSIVSDTSNWTLIYGQFTAQGGERYIVIGNFFSNLQTDTLRVLSLQAAGGYKNDSYYYIDDINVHCYTCDSLDHTGISEVKVDKDTFKLYPNPNNGNMTLEYSLDNAELAYFTIFDITGREVKQQSISSQRGSLLINADELNAGIYYYVLTQGNTRIKSERLVIIK